MNFFDSACQSGPFHLPTFGLCDDQSGGLAYVDTDPSHTKKWIATIRNPLEKAVTFTAIDKCVIRDDQAVGQRRCDGMLTTDNLLCLIELKDKEKKWMPSAVAQLESTIKFLLSAHPVIANRYPRKRACACNKRRRIAREIRHNHQKLFAGYGFEFSADAEVWLDDPGPMTAGSS